MAYRCPSSGSASISLSRDRLPRTRSCMLWKADIGFWIRPRFTGIIRFYYLRRWADAYHGVTYYSIVWQYCMWHMHVVVWHCMWYAYWSVTLHVTKMLECDNDNDNNYSYSAHKPKRRKRIWGAHMQLQHMQYYACHIARDMHMMELKILFMWNYMLSQTYIITKLLGRSGLTLQIYYVTYSCTEAAWLLARGHHVVPAAAIPMLYDRTRGHVKVTSATECERRCAASKRPVME